jgi:hypothetical protein
MKAKAFLENMDPFFPADFFTCNAEVQYGKEGFLLPDVSELLGEEKFIAFTLSWTEEEIAGSVLVKSPMTSSSFPDYDKGDAIEVFIDTRDNKKVGCPTRFCHQFVFLPFEVDGVTALEVTRFRPEDAHELCEASLLHTDVKKEKEGYSLFFTLPKDVLHGYDPLQFPRLGFAYKVHRYKKEAGHFPFSSKRFSPLQNPSLWASLTLKGP